MSNYEQKRLHALRQLNLLDTPASESFDRITRMASQLFSLPVAAVSLTDTDRQWFKSRVGIELWQIPRHKSPCSNVSKTSDVLVIEDFLATEWYRDSPPAQLGLRFYAGAPLLTRDGYTLGTMCVLGPEPRSVTQDEICSLQDLSILVMAQIELQHAFSRVDPLTGLPNSNQFTEDLEDFGRDLPGQQRFLFFIELLGITQLNTFHRVMGATNLDELAKEGGRHLQWALQETDTLYYVGTCQYAFLRKAQNEVAVQKEALRLNDRLKQLNLYDNLPVTVRPAVGIAPFRYGLTTPVDVLRMAHGACQDARQGEIPAAMYSSALDESYRRSFTLLTDMRRALAGDNELYLVFQPSVALDSGICMGGEALLRWQHPTLGPISPEEFIPLIENTPLARHLTAWVIRSAIAQAAIWYRQGLALRISMNVMASNLEEEGFTAQLLEALAEWQLPVGTIELELTESALLSNGRVAQQQLEALVSAGVELAIDDFGSGYSNLAYLQNLPASVVKIDRTFFSERYDENRGQTLLKAMTTLANDLGYRTVAEGAEPLVMLKLLEELHCDEVQSFMVARPMVPEAFEAWLTSFGQNSPQRDRPSNILASIKS
ncbi:MAG: EAL domain-containing protein [Halomonadaceae bacterium]|nr:MAG: EAL domain-containing protein [Halomonadaceae bacterium]